MYAYYMFVSLLAMIYCIHLSCTAIIQTSCFKRLIVFVLVRSIAVFKLYLDSISSI